MSHFRVVYDDGTEVDGAEASYLFVERSRLVVFAVCGIGRILWRTPDAPLIYRRRTYSKGPGSVEEVMHVMVMSPHKIVFVHDGGRVFSARHFGAHIPFHRPDAVTPQEAVVLALMPDLVRPDDDHLVLP